jgi:peptide-methionine (S)-S-oxide reductase
MVYSPNKFFDMKSFLLMIAVTSLMACQSEAQNNTDNMQMPSNVKTETAILGAGCFWCVEAVFQDLKGVYKVESGYAGGQVPNPSYKDVCTGATGHAEVARITFDPSVISFETLLKVFWTTHDPTTLNRQGADVGTQYRSAIFYTTDSQRQIAEKSKAEFAPTLWDEKIVTEITPAPEFYVAEDYHQNYYNENPNAGYCRIVINPKVRKMREKFADLLKEDTQ